MNGIPIICLQKGIIPAFYVQMPAHDILEELRLVFPGAAGPQKTRECLESVIVTFVGVSCPFEIKVWPLLHSVVPLTIRSLQCPSCWRFGHTSKA